MGLERDREIRVYGPTILRGNGMAFRPLSVLVPCPSTFEPAVFNHQPIAAFSPDISLNPVGDFAIHSKCSSIYLLSRLPLQIPCKAIAGSRFIRRSSVA